MDKWLRWLVAVSIVVVFTACSRKPQQFRKETVPVKGEVYVDGNPASNLQVTLHDVKGMDTQHPTFSTAMTDDKGKFVVSTYNQGDGVPEGEYTITFMWGQLNLLSMQYGGPDKLKGRYSDPKKSQFRCKVEKGKPTDLGKIELTTK